MAELLKVENISKSFYGNTVLSEIDFDLAPGELLAVVGENGAGKSTLMKILSGVYQPDGGTIVINGQVRNFSSASQARDAGVGIIYQELSLVSQLSIAENIFLGNEPTHFGFIDSGKMHRDATEILQRLGLNLDSRKPCWELTVGEQQMVEIARAASTEVKMMIMDEPTAALNDKETKALFELIERMKSQGIGILYISHRLDEIFQIADRIMVIRDGRHIITKPVNELTRDEIVNHMVGRQITDMYPRENHSTNKNLLVLQNVTVPGLLENISLTIHAGEILGVAGLMGCGKTELANTLFGRYQYKGEIFCDGKPVKISSPGDAISQGIALIPEDRKKEGLVVGLSTRENISLPNLDDLSQRGFVLAAKEKQLVNTAVEKLNVRVLDQEAPVQYLSGGNQQKIVLGKWVERGCQVLILNEPTRGIDVGARTEIYRLLNELTAAGNGVLLISSDLPEVLGMSDRILVMNEGRIAAELSCQEANQEKVMQYAIGGNDSE